MNHPAANGPTAFQLVKAMRENRLRDFARENALALDHFITPLSDRGWTPLHYGVYSGRLGEIREVLQPSGALFDSGDFLLRDKIGRTPLGMAVVRRNLADVFLPSYWAGRVGEMEKLWKKVPEKHRDDIDYPALRGEAIFLSVHGRVPRLAADLWGALRSWAVPLRNGAPSREQDRS